MFDTLVAAVLTLRMLPLLYRVNALVLVAALLVPDRQLLDVVLAESTDACDTDAGESPRWRFAFAVEEVADPDEIEVDVDADAECAGEEE